MKCFLIREASSIFWNASTSYGLGMVGTVASAVAEVRILDNNSKYKRYTNAQLLQEIDRFDPHVVGFSIHAFNILASGQLIRAVKKRFPHLCLIGGGLHTFTMPHEVSETGVDIVVKGEAELAIKPLLRALDEQPVNRNYAFVIGNALAAVLDSIPGLLFHAAHRPARTDTGMGLYVQDLDTLPFINYDLFNLHDYLKYPGDDLYVTNVLVTQRGCPYPCPFCHVEESAALNNVRENSSAYRLALVDHLATRYNPKHLIIYDSNFTLRRKSALDFCLGFRARGFHERMTFFCQTNVVIKLDDELVLAMRQAGCTEVGLGIERLSKRALELIRKNRNYERILHNIGILNRYGMHVQANCLLGFPFDTRETVEEEQRLFASIQDQISVFAVFILQPAPGTEVYELTPYKRWYLEKKFVEWKPSFYHISYNYATNAWDANFFNLDPETQKAIRVMKEHFHTLSIAKMNSPLLDLLHQLERGVAKASFALYCVSPNLERILFWLPTMVRKSLHNYLLQTKHPTRNPNRPEDPAIRPDPPDNPRLDYHPSP
ncbi:MAG: radical SAM protein [Magnetococcales bacterium]|nr:radical SAM protein [Magnetococcales bacterium]MBF0116792.1 radical SAM protein [Magnetococcales bacterium]